MRVAAHRDDPKAAAMYRLYQTGFSLAQVGRAFSITRQGVFKMFARRGYALRGPRVLPFIVWAGRKYTRRANGYYARTNSGRYYLHRDIWAQTNGPIPAGFDIHHRDGDKTNNTLSNLELLTQAEHGTRHGFAGNQTVPSTGRRPVRN